MIYYNLNRAALNIAIAHSPPYLVPVLITARDIGLDIFPIPQRPGPFTIAFSVRPPVSIIGDDTDRALGPSGFHRQSISHLFERCDSVFIIGCAPDPLLYAAAATTAAFLRRRIVIIETRLAQEQSWITFVQTSNPNVHMVVGTATGGRA